LPYINQGSVWGSPSDALGKPIGSLAPITWTTEGNHVPHQTTPATTPEIPNDPNLLTQGVDSSPTEEKSPYDTYILPEYRKRQRDQEFQKLKSAYNIKGDTWETAKGYDTVGQKNLDAFIQKWEQMLADNKYESYSINAGFGTYAPTGMNSGYNSLLNFKSNY
jgi:hypothetical protein